MSDELVHLTIDDGVATITLDSPANRNALSTALVAELAPRPALDVAEADASVRAIVLTHTPPAFCAGADLKERRAGPPDSSPFVDVLRRLMDAEVPTIAAVNGPARAGGIGLMAACDLVVVRDDITFALTEVRIGVAAAIISVPILRRANASHLAAAFLTGEQFDATAARDAGLVTHVSTDVAATVAALCEGIRMGAPRAVAETKRMLRLVPTLSRDEAFARMPRPLRRVVRRPRRCRGHGRLRREAPAPVGVAVVFLLVAGPLFAELISTYLPTSGDLLVVLGSIVFLAPLYGGAALVIRDVTLRPELGWRARLLLAASFGVLMPTLVDGALFTADDPDIENWDEIMTTTQVRGISVYAVTAWVAGHVALSIGAPIAIAEGLVPTRRHDPWVSRRVLVTIALLGIAVALLIRYDVETERANLAESLVSAAVVGALATLAFTVPRRRPRIDRPNRLAQPADRPPPPASPSWSPSIWHRSTGSAWR